MSKSIVQYLPFVLVALLIVSGVFLMGVQTGNIQTPVSVEEQFEQRVQPQAENSGAPKPTPGTQNRIFTLKVTNKQGGVIDPSDLRLAVLSMLQISPETLHIYHDDRFTISDSTNIFYLFAPTDATSLNSPHDTFIIQVISENPELEPYLSNPNYCQKDTDCVGEGYFCSVGAYNGYHEWAPFGCGYVTGVQGYSSEELKAATSKCPVSEFSGEPSFSADFSTAKCLNNSCQAQDIKITCEKRQ
ncbi:hypothetical protein KA078_03340 [Candidatus Woesebacteria bacterium]|nr:hypothetical protein [Candidatus Woesebacteria bacterium]